MAKKEIKGFKGGFIGYDVLKNSPMGNPRYRIFIYSFENNDLRDFETYPNSSLAYEILNHYKKNVIIKYHTLKNWKVIIDDIKDIN